MEDLAASLMPHAHSAPVYLLYDASSFRSLHGLPAPALALHGGGGGDDDDGFEFATAPPARIGCGGFGAAAALRACASDVSGAAYADELFRAGALLPLTLPPRLQRPASSAGASAATSPVLTSSSSAAPPAGRSARKHRGFDPFAAALEKVRRDGGAPRRARSLSPLRAAAAATASTAHSKDGAAAGAAVAAQREAARRARRGVRHLLCRAVMAGAAAAAPRALWPRRKHGVAYRPGLLVCLGFGV